METTRQPKIARQIQRDIADIFQKEGRDLLRGTLVTVTEVRVSPDFNYAKIYVSIFPFDKAPETMAVLDKQNRFIRRELGAASRTSSRGCPKYSSSSTIRTNTSSTSNSRWRSQHKPPEPDVRTQRRTTAVFLA